MKITTEDCVKAIIKHFYDQDLPDTSLLSPKNWKRLSKTGSGDNITRTFENKSNGTVVKVMSTETKILHIAPGKPKITNLKAFLRDNLINAPEEFWNVHYDIFGEDEVVNWPQINPSDFLNEPGINRELYPEYDDEDDLKEPQDMENFEWLSVTDEELVIACGGDWQEPLKITMKIVNGKLTVTKTEKVADWVDGMSQEELLRAINS
jgi:hypothetical protein